MNQTFDARRDRPHYRVPSNDDHERISALFLGPKAENSTLLGQCFNMVVQKQIAARQAYFPSDPVGVRLLTVWAGLSDTTLFLGIYHF